MVLDPKGLAPFLFLNSIQRLVGTQDERVGIDSGTGHVLAVELVLGYDLEGFPSFYNGGFAFSAVEINLSRGIGGGG